MRWHFLSVLVLAAFMKTSLAQVPDFVKRTVEAANEQAGEETQAVDHGNQQKSGHWVTTKTKDGTEVRLYVSKPENATGALPALIVVQEWWGVTEDIQQRTDDFSRHGYLAAAVDLYDGKATSDPKEAAQLRTALTDAGCLLRLKAGLDYVNDAKAAGVAVDPNRVGVIGWCMGGEYALKLAVSDPRIKATAIFYGPLITEAQTLKTVQGPVLGIFGETDKNPSPHDVDAFQRAMKEDGKDVTIYSYSNVGHAFASPAAKAMGMYHEKEARDAWEKTWAWLDANLMKKQ